MVGSTLRRPCAPVAPHLDRWRDVRADTPTATTDMRWQVPTTYSAIRNTHATKLVASMEQRASAQASGRAAVGCMLQRRSIVRGRLCTGIRPRQICDVARPLPTMVTMMSTVAEVGRVALAHDAVAVSPSPPLKVNALMIVHAAPDTPTDGPTLDVA